MRGRLGLTSKKVPLEKSTIREKFFPYASLQGQVRIVLQASSGPVPGIVDVLEGQLERPDVSLRLLHPSWHLGRYQVGTGVGICTKKQFIAISKIFNKALLRHRKHALWSRSNENRSAGFAIVVYFFLAREIYPILNLFWATPKRMFVVSIREQISRSLLAKCSVEPFAQPLIVNFC